MVLGPPQLADRRISTGLGAVHERGEHAVAQEPHDLHLGVRLGEALADVRVGGEALLLGERRQLVQLAAERDGVDGCAGAALVAEQGHCDHPAAVHLADDVLLGAAGVGEVHLVELGVTRHHLDGAHLHAGLAHVDEQERDAAVLDLVHVGAREHEDVVRQVAGGRPDLLAVDDPLVTVEHRAAAEVAEVRTR